MDAKLDCWRAAMADLMLSCAAADADHAAELVTALDSLLRAAPPAAGIAIPSPLLTPIESGREADAAALGLAARLGSYLLSQGRGGPVMATVVLGPDNQESHGEGPCPALALVGALAAGFAAEANVFRVPGLGQSPAVSIN